MPAAPRPSKKAESIVYNIIGKPANMQKHKTRTRRARMILVEETRLLR